MNNFIRSTFHPLKEANPGKLQNIQSFIQEYHSAVLFCLQYLWNSKIEWVTNDHKIHIWDRKNNLLQCPSMIKTPEINYSGKLSARALKCAYSKDLKKRDWILSHNRKPGKGLLNRIEKGLGLGCQFENVPPQKKVNFSMKIILLQKDY